jgi:hypothetical protein
MQTQTPIVRPGTRQARHTAHLRLWQAIYGQPWPFRDQDEAQLITAYLDWQRDARNTGARRGPTSES